MWIKVDFYKVGFFRRMSTFDEAKRIFLFHKIQFYIPSNFIIFAFLKKAALMLCYKVDKQLIKYCFSIVNCK